MVRNDLTAHYKQVADIDLGVFTPIGWREDSCVGFSGTYNGNGYKITNAQIKAKIASNDWVWGGRPYYQVYGGIFAILTGTVTNLVVEGTCEPLTKGSLPPPGGYGNFGVDYYMVSAPGLK